MHLPEIFYKGIMVKYLKILDQQEHPSVISRTLIDRVLPSLTTKVSISLRLRLLFNQMVRKYMCHLFIPDPCQIQGL